MAATDKTSLGDRMKSYETPSTSRKVFKGQPLIVRLDGKSFHSFTKGLARPYDERLSNFMRDTTKALVEHFHATVGYCQSDEITLAWYYESDSDGDYPFVGRLQKIESLMAAYATAWFNKHLIDYLPEKSNSLPTFDARAFVVPNLLEAYHSILWRQQDCTKNAISMAAQSMFSHKSLQGKSGPEMQERMWKEKAINFNDFPPFFKRGTFVKRVKRTRMLTSEELAKIPEKYQPTEPVTRSFVEIQDIWLGKTINSGVDILFNGADAVYNSEFK